MVGSARLSPPGAVSDARLPTERGWARTESRGGPPGSSGWHVDRIASISLIPLARIGPSPARTSSPFASLAWRALAAPGRRRQHSMRPAAARAFGGCLEDAPKGNHGHQRSTAVYPNLGSDQRKRRDQRRLIAWSLDGMQGVRGSNPSSNCCCPTGRLPATPVATENGPEPRPSWEPSPLRRARFVLSGGVLGADDRLAGCNATPDQDALGVDMHRPLGPLELGRRSPTRTSWTGCWTAGSTPRRPHPAIAGWPGCWPP